MLTTVPSALRVQRSGRLTVVEFVGDAEEFDPARAEVEIRSIVQENHSREVAFDLTNVDYLTSEILSFFIASLNYVGKVHVFNPSDFNVDLIRATKLDSVLNIRHGWFSGLYAERTDTATLARQEVESDVAEAQTDQEEFTTEGDLEMAAQLRDLRDHVANQITGFEAALSDELDVAIAFGDGMSLRLETITFRGEQLVVFAGKSEDGVPYELIQHVMQTNFVLTGTKRADPGVPRRGIAIHTKSFPVAKGVVRD